MGLIDQMLIQGDDSLLYQELVKKRGFAGEISGGINADLGDMFDYSGPMLWTTSLIHDVSAKPEQILSATDSVIQERVSNRVDQELIDSSVTKMRSYLYESMTQFGGFGRANLMACFALFDDDPAKINSLDGNFRKVTPEMIQRTARTYLKPANRTVLVIEPGAAEPGAAKPARAAAEGQK
jgi:predicted Zn-dependent peptidase